MIEPQDIRVTSYLPQSGHGAGGMTVGLTTSGIIVHHIPTGLGVSCDSERSQYANKEKALKMLEHVLRRDALVNSAQRRFETGPQDIAQMLVPDRVSMIKEVRVKTGCGLKEAKVAVDLMGNVDDAVQHLTTSTGYCERWEGCVCGEYLPAIREGCSYWQK